MAATRLVVGNWKLNGRLSQAEAWAQAASQAISAGGALFSPGTVRLAVAPPATLMAAMRVWLADTPIELAAQDLYTEDSGPYTGALSAPMFADAGARFALVGHSERRAMFFETDVGCGARLRACARHGLTPILCLGETLVERDAGLWPRVVIGQLEAAAQAYLAQGPQPLVLAYEPIWAIGSGRVASPAQAQEVHARLRETLVTWLGKAYAQAVPLVYGGSVKPDNAAALFAEDDIDGALVGGASLDAADFIAIACAGLSHGGQSA